MPLNSKMSVGSMIHELKTKGKKKRSRKQMLAIALSVKRRGEEMMSRKEMAGMMKKRKMMA